MPKADISASPQVEALWSKTEPMPAEQQQPLWSVELEGERALHYFETLPPEAAFRQLLALGLSCALHALSRSQGAAVPCACPPLDRYTISLCPLHTDQEVHISIASCMIFCP